MDDRDQGGDTAFFAMFREYYDLERHTARQFGQGEYTLERMGVLAELAGHPEQRLTIIHVAGTKGKGSTAFYIGALLRTSGCTCGVYTSPHLVTVRERFTINDDFVTHAVLLAGAREFEARLQDAGLKPTLFEIMTVLALRLFVQAGCEYAVLETGIGGLLDATNYVPAPRCTVITPISYDHTQLLGSTIAEIATQKAGIIKPGIPVVCSRQPFAAAAEVITATAAARNAPLHQPVPVAETEPWLRAVTPELPLFLRENLQAALRVTKILGLAPDPERFRLPRPPGRCQVLRREPLVIIDAAHNADSSQRLAEHVLQAYPGVRFTVVLGVVAGKDAAGIFAALQHVAGEFVLTNPETSTKGSELPALRELAARAGVAFRVVPALAAATDLPSDRPLLFTGSFFTALIGARLFGHVPSPG